MTGALMYCSPKVTDATKSTEKKAKDVATSFRSTAPKAGPAREIKIGDYESFTLDNGLKVIVVENHKLPRISYQLFIDKDYNLEGEYSGLSGIAGDLLTKGTSKWTKSEIDEAVDYIGASLSTSSRGGFASSLTKHTENVLGIFSEVVKNPSFPEAEFDKIKNQTISGLQTEKDDPNAISRNVSNALVYGKDHPYGEITTELTVSNVTLDMAKEYYHTYFKPNISYLVIVGDVRPARAKELSNKFFGDWKKGEVPGNSFATPMAPQETTVDFVDKAGAVQSVINITYPVNLKPGEPDVIPGRVMNNILGSGFSGRLFTNLREDKAYTYGAYSSLSADELVGTFSANASVRNEVTDSAVTQFMLELNRIANEPVTAEELELAKNSIAGSFARGLESPNTVASFALNTYRYNLNKDYYNKYLANLSKVGIEDVMAVAKKYIRPENARIVVVGNMDEVADKLGQFSKSGKVNHYDFYGSPKKMDMEAAGDMQAKDVILGYLNAIGGRDALSKIESAKTTMSMDMMGTSLDVVVLQKPPMFSMSMNAQGMTMVKQVFDGEKALVEQMGQKQVLEGKDASAMANQGKIAPELDYLSAPYEIELKGVEDVDGVSCYKVGVVDSEGQKSTEYYSVDSGLKLKAITTVEQGGQKATITNEYKDYKEVDGIMMPHTFKTSGASPVPMEMKVSKIELNVPIEDSVFKVE